MNTIRSFLTTYSNLLFTPLKLSIAALTGSVSISKELTAAIAATALYTDGDIIEVMSGTYNENVVGRASVGLNLVLRSATINGNVNVNTEFGEIFITAGAGDIDMLIEPIEKELNRI